MLFFVGAIIVIGSVLGGFMMHGGQVLVLNQPTEFIIIGGAALGSVIISTPDQGPQGRDRAAAGPAQVCAGES